MDSVYLHVFFIHVFKHKKCIKKSCKPVTDQQFREKTRTLTASVSAMFLNQWMECQIR